MSEQTRKLVIRTAGILIVMLALRAALLPLERGLPGRLVVGYLLLATGLIELCAALARRIHKPTAAIAGAATVLAGLRLVLDPNAGFFPVLNLVILWLVVRAAALAFAATRSGAPLRSWLVLAGATDFALAQAYSLCALPGSVDEFGLCAGTSCGNCQCASGNDDDHSGD